MTRDLGTSLFFRLSSRVHQWRSSYNRCCDVCVTKEVTTVLQSSITVTTAWHISSFLIILNTSRQLWVLLYFAYLMKKPIAFRMECAWHCVIVLKWLRDCFFKDLDRCVTLFKNQPDDDKEPWVYVGKQRAHYKTIQGIELNIYEGGRRERLIYI